MESLIVNSQFANRESSPHPSHLKMHPILPCEMPAPVKPILVGDLHELPY